MNWLIATHNFSKRAASDTVSRIKRADKIYRISDSPNPLYFYRLQQTDEFNQLSVSVRSQIKRATALYSDYLNEAIGGN